MNQTQQPFTDERKQYLLNVAIEEGERNRIELGGPVHIPELVKDKDYARAARLRLDRAKFISNEFELARLEVRHDIMKSEPTAPGQKAECLKAIMELRVKAVVKNLA